MEASGRLRIQGQIPVEEKTLLLVFENFSIKKDAGKLSEHKQ